MAAIQDIDQGYAGIMARLAQADGLEARIGILSGTPKYPKSKVQVAKVGGVHHISRTFNDVFDTTAKERARDIEVAHAAIINGTTATDALLRVAMRLRDDYRHAVAARGLIKTGRLKATVRAAIFDGRKHVAGDNPRGPKMSEGVAP